MTLELSDCCLDSLASVYCVRGVTFTSICARGVFPNPLSKVSMKDSKLKVSFSVCPSVSPSLDQHPVPSECFFQPPVPPLHRGYAVHRREPGTLQPQTHSEPCPEAAALPGSVYKQHTNTQQRNGNYKSI